MVVDAEVLPSIRMAVDGYVNLGRHKSWRIGAGASLTEFTVPKKMGRMITAFETYYPYVTSEGMTFFREHKEADEEHGALIIQILTKYCKTEAERAEAREGYFFKLDLHRVILDAVHYELLRNNGR
jgi:pyrroloquinoline quinone (PQQ) biosynthesis protein C